MRLTKSIFIITLLIISFNPISIGYAQSPLWNPNYNKVQKLVFDNSASAEDLVNFTVLIHLNSSIIDWDDFQTDGDDIRFIDADYETWLSYEVETWNHGYDAWIWVKIPQIDSNSAIDHIYMYYDNLLAINGEDKEGTWNSNYVMVQHMVDETNASILDSTQYDNDGTKIGVNEPIEIINGQIDSAQDFDGLNDYVDCGNDTTINFGATDSFTVEGWIYSDSYASNGYMLDKRVKNYGAGYYYMIRTNYVRFGIEDTGGINPEVSSDAVTISAGQWIYIVAVRDVPNDKLIIYIDGQKMNDVVDTTTNTLTHMESLTLGKGGAEGATEIFNGTIDSVRISNTTRSADWIKAQYLSMTENYVTYKELSLCDSLTDSGILIGIFILVPIIAILIGVNRRR